MTEFRNKGMFDLSQWALCDSKCDKIIPTEGRSTGFRGGDGGESVDESVFQGVTRVSFLSQM